MIVSASRRTDIPSFYSEWFFNRLKEEYVLVRNPMNFHQISRISLSPEVVDGIVFWTKNPAPMLGRLDELEKYHYYFQFTLNAYGTEVENNLPSKNDVIIPIFQRLSGEIGREKVVWRYDPIFFNEKYTMEYHCRYFERLASKLAPYTEKCIVSFIDIYKNTKRSAGLLHMREPDAERQYELMEKFADTAQKYDISMDTCVEANDFGALGVGRAHCIDRQRLERIGHYTLKLDEDKNQRKNCGCAAAIDVGAYNTCKNGCLYCYANYMSAAVSGNMAKHDPKSPLLFGEIREDDIVKERAVGSLIVRQSSWEDWEKNSASDEQ